MAEKLFFPYPLTKTLLLVGMPGAGKTSVGKRLAKIFEIPFIDADDEIEKAGGSAIADLFNIFGETEFRRAEEKIMERLLKGPVCVLSSGGGAFISEKTRENAKKYSVSLFLDAHIDTLVRNTIGRSHRPLLNSADPSEALKKLLSDRRKYYELADIHLPYEKETLGQVIRRAVTGINDYARK
ncbi:MAG: shikimate kinase [Alphaproteobacteria bacterium]|nr:shikimate kinase [Alphaproteobacteria bacterium]